jgi:hypothetical protein
MEYAVTCPAVRGLLKTKEDYNQSVNPSIMRQAMLIFLKQKSLITHAMFVKDYVFLKHNHFYPKWNMQ